MRNIVLTNNEKMVLYELAKINDKILTYGLTKEIEEELSNVQVGLLNILSKFYN
ncbi:MAG: hypothetical protein PUD24_02745 [Oscillospiraceae bacterium]|nr:hypothetical protein [Oscillospiraceae bacterium]